ncbi:uncharacterized protein LOC133662701 [Entelurus aequoreus]|uniref:uncharacterized protein LOC133662701 n=1 Tax=Entelurus aequoreus TaxID=161455 RepID=UPI002B1D9203|nr:uncharacterized protein LOC133662701 [Entelurus aequoreus]
MEQTPGLVFPDNEPEVSVPSAHALVRRCRRIWAAARLVLIRQRDRMKKTADRKRRPAPAYQPWHRVWLSTKDMRLKVPSKKLAPRFIGPYPITRVIGPSAVRLRLPRSLRVYPTFHVSRVKPVKVSPLVPATTSPPPPEMIEGGPVYKVKKLLAVRSRGRGRQYLVDWEGYGPEERQWVPSQHIVDSTLIEDFHKVYITLMFHISPSLSLFCARLSRSFVPVLHPSSCSCLASSHDHVCLSSVFQAVILS